MRIVSLLPSATEILCLLGLRDQLVGVTHECDYPLDVAALPRVTRTLIPTDASSRDIDALVKDKMKTQRALYTLDLPVFEQLCPDLIVTQTLCDVCAVAEDEVRAAACLLPGAPRVVNLEPTTLAEVLVSIAQVADAAGIPDRGNAVIGRLQQRLAIVAGRTARLRERPRVLLLEWIDPPFCSGHWNPELVERAGGRECFGRSGQRSRQVTWDEIRQAAPEVLVVACCGFDVPRTLQDVSLLPSQPGWQELPCVRAGRVYVVDGAAYFSRPGPRLVDSLEILAHALHPEVHPLPDHLPAAHLVGGSCHAASPLAL